MEESPASSGGVGEEIGGGEGVNDRHGVVHRSFSTNISATLLERGALGDISPDPPPSAKHRRFSSFARSASLARGDSPVGQRLCPDRQLVYHAGSHHAATRLGNQWVAAAP